MVMGGFRLRNGHDKPSVLHAFQANQATGKLLHLLGFPMDDQDFETGIMIEMRMTRRDDQFVVSMLDFGKLLRYAVCMMVVDERNGADYRRARTCCLFCDQTIADQITESLGPVRVAEPGNEVVKSLQKI